jgi:hypothetical protein
VANRQAQLIINAAVAYISAAGERLAASKFSETALARFHSNISGQLKRSSYEMLRLGWSAGKGSGPAPNELAQRYVNEQLHFLENWIADMAQSGTFIGGVGRASMYGESLGQVYQRAYIAARGSRDGLPALPAYPRDGSTQCLTHCRCEWRIKKVSVVYYEAVWKLGIAEHCETCIQRSRDWAPLSIIRPQGKDPLSGDLIIGEWQMSDARGRPIEVSADSSKA